MIKTASDGRAWCVVTAGDRREGRRMPPSHRDPPHGEGEIGTKMAGRRTHCQVRGRTFLRSAAIASCSVSTLRYRGRARRILDAKAQWLTPIQCRVASRHRPSWHREIQPGLGDRRAKAARDYLSRAAFGKPHDDDQLGHGKTPAVEGSGEYAGRRSRAVTVVPPRSLAARRMREEGTASPPRCIYIPRSTTSRLRFFVLVDGD